MPHFRQRTLADRSNFAANHLGQIELPVGTEPNLMSNLAVLVLHALLLDVPAYRERKILGPLGNILGRHFEGPGFSLASRGSFLATTRGLKHFLRRILPHFGYHCGTHFFKSREHVEQKIKCPKSSVKKV